MALNKDKLTDISYRGFSVAELERMDRGLRDIVNALHKEDFVAATGAAAALAHEADTVGRRCLRIVNRASSKKAEGR